MEKKKFIIWVFAIMFISAGILSVTAIAGSKTEFVPRVLKVVKWVGFPGDGKASYEVDSENGCIQNFFYKNGKPIKPKQPGWLREGKKTVDFGSFTDSQCRQGVISIGGSPIEFWGYANGSYFCIGAWDPACPAWYQPCRDKYPSCP